MDKLKKNVLSLRGWYQTKWLEKYSPFLVLKIYLEMAEAPNSPERLGALTFHNLHNDDEGCIAVLSLSSINRISSGVRWHFLKIKTTVSSQRAIYYSWQSRCGTMSPLTGEWIKGVSLMHTHWNTTQPAVCGVSAEISLKLYPHKKQWHSLPKETMAHQSVSNGIVECCLHIYGH